MSSLSAAWTTRSAGPGAESCIAAERDRPASAFADVAGRPQEIPGAPQVIWPGDATPDQFVTADLVDAGGGFRVGVAV